MPKLERFETGGWRAADSNPCAPDYGDFFAPPPVRTRKKKLSPPPPCVHAWDMETFPMGLKMYAARCDIFSLSS